MIENMDLDELRQTQLTSVTVGLGSIVIQFGTGAHILVQCPFEVSDGGLHQSGHGETPSSAVVLFKLLNHRTDLVELDREKILCLHFEGDLTLRIVPKTDGLESYVLATRHGICPVIVV